MTDILKIAIGAIEIRVKQHGAAYALQNFPEALDTMARYRQTLALEAIADALKVSGGK